MLGRQCFWVSRLDQKNDARASRFFAIGKTHSLARRGCVEKIASPFVSQNTLTESESWENYSVKSRLCSWEPLTTS